MTLYARGFNEDEVLNEIKRQLIDLDKNPSLYQINTFVSDCRITATNDQGWIATCRIED